MIYLYIGVYYLLRVYFYVLIASILLSWLPEIKSSKFGQFVERLANPYMRIFRGIFVFGMFDFTPMIGIILYQTGLYYVARAINLM